MFRFIWLLKWIQYTNLEPLIMTATRITQYQDAYANNKSFIVTPSSLTYLILTVKKIALFLKYVQHLLVVHYFSFLT